MMMVWVVTQNIVSKFEFRTSVVRVTYYTAFGHKKHKTYIHHIYSLQIIIAVTPILPEKKFIPKSFFLLEII